MKVNKSKSLFLFLLLGLLFRLSIAYFQYSGDVRNHIAWGEGMLSGMFGFFDQKFAGFNDPNYPPLTIILFGLSSWLYQIFGKLVSFLNQTIPIFPSKLVFLMPTLNMKALFLKLPSIFADIGIAWTIYHLTSSKKETIKKLVVGLFLFNPAVIYLSTVWGQIESIPILFLLLSLLALKKNKSSSKISSQNFYLSHLFFILAALSKQTALWLLPVFIVLWLKNKPLKIFLQGLFLQVIVFVLLYLPFTHSLIKPFVLYLQTLAGSSTLASEAVWNIWHFIYPPSTQDSTLLLGLSIRLWSILLILLSIAFIIIKFSKNKLTLYQSLFWLSLAAFFLQTRVHEKHLFPALVFFILDYRPSLSRTIGFLFLTFYHLSNLYWTLGLPFV